MPADRWDETLARRIVHHALPSVTVTKHDDGSRVRMVDALITYPDQRIAALEVVSDRDEAYHDVLAAVTRQGTVLDAPTLKCTWWITVEDTARIRKLRKEIVGRLEVIGAEPALRDLAWPDPARWSDAARIGDALSPLGVERARPIRLPDGGPKVIIIPRILVGREGEPNALPVWAVRLLTDTHPDVPRKLAESGYPDRHAFIWTTFTTPYEIASTLDGEAFPTQAPELPDGVTHLWVGSWFAGRRTLCWRPEHGWSEAYRIPRDGNVELSDS